MAINLVSQVLLLNVLVVNYSILKNQFPFVNFPVYDMKTYSCFSDLQLLYVFKYTTSIIMSHVFKIGICPGKY